MARQRSAPTVRLRRLGAQLREIREARGMTQEDVSERTGKDRSTLHRIETALQRPQKATLIQLLDLYGVSDPQRDDLLTLLRESAQRGWLQQYRDELPEVYTDYISLEDDARSISNYESLYVPGLLQTEGYARAQLRGGLPYATGEEIDTRVDARVARQAILDREKPPKLWVIMDEAALRRLVGGSDVMRCQARHLRETATRPNITVQVIPFGAGAHPGMDGAFVILDFPEPADPSIVYTESAAGGLFLEEKTELHRYTLKFEHLRATALSPDATIALLGAIAAES